MVPSRRGCKKIVKEITRLVNLRTEDSPLENKNCAKSVQIWSCSGPCLDTFHTMIALKAIRFKG